MGVLGFVDVVERGLVGSERGCFLFWEVNEWSRL